MSSKNYPQVEEPLDPQEAATRPETERLLIPLTQAINGLTQVVAELQNQFQERAPQPAPNPFEGTAAENAVEVFNSILAGLQLKPVPPKPDKVAAEPIPRTQQINLKWNWPGKEGEADGFKIWRCQSDVGKPCEEFIEIEKKVSPDKRSYEDRSVTGGQTYRYKLTAFKFRRESAFSDVVSATTDY
jgi:hypothetical protein